MKAYLYARCSTDEKRQDVEVQFEPLRRYCKAYGWEWEEFWEYDSGYKGEQKVLKEIMEKLRRKEGDILLVTSLDRFSRQPPATTETWLNQITQHYKARFISLQENLDSENEMLWYAMKGMWSYFAHLYSLKLSEKIKGTVRRGDVTKSYRGKKWGRPEVKVDIKEVAILHAEGYSIRTIAKTLYVSRDKIHRVIKSHPELFKKKPA